MTMKLKTDMKDKDLINDRNVCLKIKESHLWYMMLALNEVTHVYKLECGLLSDELHKIGVDEFKWTK